MTKTASTNMSQIFVRDLVFSGKAIVGQRDNQEDYSLFRTLDGGSHLLAVMADGMGGHASGEVASKKAVEAFNEAFVSFPSESVTAKLAAALQQANAEVAQSIKDVPALDGMGCTIVGIHIGRDGLQWVSVGDSILYLFRGKKLIRLNADHSMMSLINDSVRSGKMSEAEASNYPFRNALRSAITGGEISLVDSPSTPLKLRRGDVVLVATDGILSISDAEIIETLCATKNKSANEMAAALITKVESKRKPKQDNTSVQIVKIPEQIGTASSAIKLALVFSALFLIVAGIVYYFTAKNPVELESIENAFKHTESAKPQPTIIPEESKATKSPKQEMPSTAPSSHSPTGNSTSSKPQKSQSPTPQAKSKPLEKSKEQSKPDQKSSEKSFTGDTLRPEQQGVKQDSEKVLDAQDKSQQTTKQLNTGCKSASKTENCAPVVESSSQ